ncbi:hypothetical protein FOL47_000256 [Perkinsus chesapeaki]|uniref:subtilisin n=1 Tax=Perkinsus chesapeaki TaxID=330153 RepID=A0A7J6KYN1_PERCH|nr:hypothetical protein FOL47_000256 [Perkinsus chesapeaki]
MIKLIILMMIQSVVAVAQQNEDCLDAFDGDGFEWEEEASCQRARRGRSLQTTKYIAATPSAVTMQMAYDSPNNTGSTDYDIVLTNTGPGVEIIDFEDIGQDLKVIDFTEGYQISPLVNRSIRVAGTPAFTRNFPRDQKAKTSTRRIILDLAGHNISSVIESRNMSAMIEKTIVLDKLSLGILQVPSTSDIAHVIDHLAAVGVIAEADLPLILTGESIAWTELTKAVSKRSFVGYDYSNIKSINESSMLDRLGAGNSWRVDDSSLVTVAVIDSGIDFTHPALEKSIFINHPETDGIVATDDDSNGFVDDIRGWNFVHDNANVMDNIGHGTHCASLIAGVSDGLAAGLAGPPYARVLPLKIFETGHTNNGRLSDALSALDYAIDKGVSISSVTWVLDSYSEVFRLAVDRAEKSGHLLVASAGNSGVSLDETAGSYPCGFAANNVICTAAGGADGDLVMNSNFGPARRPFPLTFDEVVAAIITTADASEGTAYGHVNAEEALQAITGLKTPRRPISVVAGDEEKTVNRIKLRPAQSKTITLRVFYLPTLIGYREYDIRGTIGGGLVKLFIEVRRSGPKDAGVCEPVNEGVADLGALAYGQLGSLTYKIHNTAAGELLIDPVKLVGWSPIITVMEPTAALTLNEGESANITLNFLAHTIGNVKIEVPSVVDGCEPLTIVATVRPSPLNITSVDLDRVSLPAGSNSADVEVSIWNPSNDTSYRAVLRPRGQYYIMEPIRIGDITSPLTSLGGGWAKDIGARGTTLECTAQQRETTYVHLNSTILFDGHEVDHVGILCNGAIRVSPFHSPGGSMSAYSVPSERAGCFTGCQVAYLSTDESFVVEWRNLGVVGSQANLTTQLHLHYDGRVILFYDGRQSLHMGDSVAVGFGYVNSASIINQTSAMALVWSPRVSSSSVVVSPLTTLTVEATLNAPPFGSGNWFLDGSCGDMSGSHHHEQAQKGWSEGIELTVSGSSSTTAPPITMSATESLYVKLLDSYGALSSYGGPTGVDVLALQYGGIVNTAETGLLVTVSMKVGEEVFEKYNVILHDGRATATFEVPAGRAPVSVMAEATREVDIPFGVVNCGGNDVVGVNGLRYLLWNPSDNRLVCALLTNSGWSAIGTDDGLNDDVWTSVLIADGDGKIAVPSRRMPRRSGMVIVGQETNTLGTGNCEGFCVFGGLFAMSQWKYMKEAGEKIIRALPLNTTTTEDPRDKKPTPEFPTRSFVSAGHRYGYTHPFRDYPNVLSFKPTAAMRTDVDVELGSIIDFHVKVVKSS